MRATDDIILLQEAYQNVNEDAGTFSTVNPGNQMPRFSGRPAVAKATVGINEDDGEGGTSVEGLRQVLLNAEQQASELSSDPTNINAGEALKHIRQALGELHPTSDINSDEASFPTA